MKFVNYLCRFPLFVQLLRLGDGHDGIQLWRVGKTEGKRGKGVESVCKGVMAVNGHGA